MIDEDYEEEERFCEECQEPIQTLDGFTSCGCEDSGQDYPYNYCARCHQTAVECGCSQGFAYDERDL